MVVPRLARVASVLVLDVWACSVERSTMEPDPLLAMLVAQCEQQQRCDCGSGADEPCDRWARIRAEELRSRAAERGAALDEACAEAGRELAEALCRDGYGRSYTEELIALEALADQCDLFHGNRALDEPCEHPQDDLWDRLDDCDEGLLCLMDDDSGPSCVAYGRGGPGDLCLDIDLVSRCDVDLACVPISDSQSECQPMMRASDPCGGWQQDYCEGPPGLYCDGSTGHCRALPGEGERCLEPDSTRMRCLPDFACDDDDVCRIRPAVGEPCMQYGECRRDLRCHDGVCMGDTAACSS